MPTANWQTQSYGRVQSLLFNNPHRVISYLVRDGDGWRERSELPAPVRRLYETETTTPERTCLRTVQFVHHMILAPGDRHVEELHIHPDAEELVVILRGTGVMTLNGVAHEVKAEDVIYIPPGATHELRNTGSDFLFCLFINIPVGDGLAKLQRASGQD